jgi:hypothetical protein
MCPGAFRVQPVNEGEIMLDTYPSHQLDYWKGRAIDQAVTLNANAAKIRQIIADTFPAPLFACPDHGPKVREVGSILEHLEDLRDRATRARSILAGGLIYLEGLRPGSLAKVTPEMLADWTGREIDQADRAYRGLPDSDLSTAPGKTYAPIIYPEDRDPLTGKPWADVAGRIAYWRNVAESQSEEIAKHPALLAKYSAARDEMHERYRLCASHADHLEDLEGHVTRLSAEVARTEKSRLILLGTFDMFATQAHEGTVPADLVKTATRVRTRAHKVWNP